MTNIYNDKSRHQLLFKRSHACTARYRHGGTASIYPLWYSGYNYLSPDDFALFTKLSLKSKRDKEESCTVIPFRKNINKTLQKNDISSENSKLLKLD